MRYMLVNTTNSNLQVDIHDPKVLYRNKNLNRPGPVISVSLQKGSSVNILKYFDNSLEKTHRCIKHSRDVLRLIRPGTLSIYVCDDEGKELDPEKLLGAKTPVDTKQDDPDSTKPDADLSAAIAAQDQFEQNKLADSSKDDEGKKEGLVSKIAKKVTGKKTKKVAKKVTKK